MPVHRLSKAGLVHHTQADKVLLSEHNECRSRPERRLSTSKVRRIVLVSPSEMCAATAAGTATATIAVPVAVADAAVGLVSRPCCSVIFTDGVTTANYSRGFSDWVSDGLYQFYANSSWLGKGTEVQNCMVVLTQHT